MHHRIWCTAFIMPGRYFTINFSAYDKGNDFVAIIDYACSELVLFDYSIFHAARNRC